MPHGSSKQEDNEGSGARQVPVPILSYSASKSSLNLDPVKQAWMCRICIQDKVGDSGWEHIVGVDIGPDRAGGSESRTSLEVLPGPPALGIR